MLGIPLLEYNKGFLVSWFSVFGFMVSWLYGFLVLWFCGFIVLWFYSCMVLWLYGYMALWFCGLTARCFYGFIVFLVSTTYQIVIARFQEDVDPISKIFKISFHGSSRFVGACI